MNKMRLTMRTLALVTAIGAGYQLCFADTAATHSTNTSQSSASKTNAAVDAETKKIDAMNLQPVTSTNKSTGSNSATDTTTISSENADSSRGTAADIDNINPATDDSTTALQNGKSDCNCPLSKGKMTLDQPSMNATRLLVWANDAAVAAFSYNYVNYRKNLQDAANYFTPGGWQAFRKALIQSGNLDAVVKQKLIVTAVATGAPVILQQGVIDNKYAWKVQIPMLVNYISPNENVSHPLNITMLITRTKPFLGETGVGVEQFVATANEKKSSDSKAKDADNSGNSSDASNADSNNANASKAADKADAKDTSKDTSEADANTADASKSAAANSNTQSDAKS